MIQKKDYIYIENKANWFFSFWYIVSANSKLSAVASSTFMNSLGDTFPVSNVLDGINGNDCNRSNVFGSGKEENPRLEITWSGAITIWRIIIYNRVDCCGK